MLLVGSVEAYPPGSVGITCLIGQQVGDVISNEGQSWV